MKYVKSKRASKQSKPAKARKPIPKSSLKRSASRIAPTVVTYALRTEVMNRIEALLFAPGQPLNTQAVASALSISIPAAQAALESLKEEYAQRGCAITLIDDAAGWRFAIKRQYRHDAASASTPVAPPAHVPARSEPAAVPDAGPIHPDHHLSKEFFDDLNARLEEISHHNANTRDDALLRDRLVDEMELLLRKAEKDGQ